MPELGSLAIRTNRFEIGEDLVDGSYLPLDLKWCTQHGTVPTEKWWWTYTTAHGEPMSDGFNCWKWTGDDAQGVGANGTWWIRNDADNWTRFGINSCDTANMLLCFEQ